MYLYFDKNGVLLEMINDEALRQYNQDVNYMYVFLENSENDSESFPIGLQCLEYWFELPDGSTTIVYNTQYHRGDEVVTELIPPSAKRDVRKFEYGKLYKMHKIRIPCGEPLEPGFEPSKSLEDNVFALDGPVAVSIRAKYSTESNEEDLTLGKVVFNIEEEVVMPSERISVSQFEYLLDSVSGSIDVSNQIKRLDCKIEELEDEFVPFRLSSLPLVEDDDESFRSKASIYVDDGETGFRMTLQQVKDMNTKIATVTSVDESGSVIADLSVGDYIYSER